MSALAGRPLDGLDAVDWAGLHHAYGSAADVPGQLRALQSADARERHQALWELYGNVYHQGTRWEASCHVVPFLAELVDDPATPGRAAVVGLLRAVAVGDLDDACLPFDPDREFAEAEGVSDAEVAEHIDWLYNYDDQREWPDSAYERGVDTRWARDAYRAAAAVSDRFTAWAGDQEPAVAAPAAELLAWFPATEAVVSRLLEIPADGEFGTARASANLTLAYLARNDPAVSTRLTALLSAGSFGVQLTAAVALAFRLGDQLPDAALTVLAEARDHAAEIHVDAFPVPWDRSLLGFAALALHRIGLSP